MKSEILHVLEEIEKAEGIEILYACEAGNRVWGFGDENSGYDVRFIYKRVNVSDYLSLRQSNDVIEYCGDDIDLIGWDIKKALSLHNQSDPCLREWLISNQVYVDKGIIDTFSDLGEFDRDVLKNHYLSMATRHWRRYCGLEYQKEKVRKYLFVIRCILIWNLLDNGIDPPISIQELLGHEHSGISDENRIAAINLINNLNSSTEISENTIFKLDNFILSSFKSMKRVNADSVRDFGPYEETFKHMLLIVK